MLTRIVRLLLVLTASTSRRLEVVTSTPVTTTPISSAPAAPAFAKPEAPCTGGDDVLTACHMP